MWKCDGGGTPPWLPRSTVSTSRHLKMPLCKAFMQFDDTSPPQNVSLRSWKPSVPATSNVAPRCSLWQMGPSRAKAYDVLPKELDDVFCCTPEVWKQIVGIVR